MSSLDEVKAMIAGASDLRARWEYVAETVMAQIEEAFPNSGISREDILELTSVRLAVVAQDDSQMMGSKILDEASQRMPTLKKMVEARELRAMLDKHDGAAEAKLAALSPLQKMQLARQQPPEKQAPPEPLTPERKAELLAENSKLRGSMKIAHARKWNLT